ncbi:MAG: hypothetical protein Q8L22_11090 [Reyranella sp.]|nr:hypothetical protein [Reyranella sp.]
MRMHIKLGLLVAALLSLASVAYATVGTPIQGTPVGLEHDPEGIAVPGGKTDAKGNATFAMLKPGRYTVFVPDRSKFKGLVVILVVSVNDLPVVTSEPMKAGTGKGYAMDKAGRKLVFTVDKPGNALVVTVVDRGG